MLFPQKMTGFSQILTGCSSHYSLWNERLQSILQNASIFKAPLKAVFVNNGCGSDAGRSWGVLCWGLVMSCFNWSWSPSLTPAHAETGTCQLCHPWASGIPRSSTVLEPRPKLRVAVTARPHLHFPATAPSLRQVYWQPEALSRLNPQAKRNCVNIWWWQCKLSKGSKEQLQLKFQTDSEIILSGIRRGFIPVCC